MSVTYLPLEAWNRHWMSVDVFMCCRRCGAIQDLTKGREFMHARGCPSWKPNEQYPFCELVAILEQETKIQAGLFL